MSIPETHRNEPFGHLVPETKLERFWAQNHGQTSLRRYRTLRFDPNACATYAPMAYATGPAQFREDLPNDDWIISALKKLIRIEFSEKRAKLQRPTFLPPSVEGIDISDAFLDGLFRNIGAEVEEIVSRIQRSDEAQESEEMAGQLFQLLCDPQIGNKANEVNVQRIDFVSQVAPAIARQERLLFILLGFPFKDQNRFRVQEPADRPDMGEISFLLRLYRATQAIYQIHPYGADILVLTDGELYGDVFGVSHGDVRRYGDTLRAVRSKLNLQGAVSFIPLSDLVQRASHDIGSDSSTGASAVALHIERRLLAILENEGLHENQLFQVLVSAMKWNHESRQLLRDLGEEDAWDVLTSDLAAVKQELRECWQSLHSTATASAVKYAAANLMLRWMDLVKQFFPDAIRCTVHAKPGQICLARSSAAFPWNGVAWSAGWPNSIDDFEVKPFHVISQKVPIRRVSVRTLGEPYFYTNTGYGTNISAARKVLKIEGWRAGEIHGRPFVAEDENDLASLGFGDDNFAWERFQRDENYYKRLLRFRLDHYEQFGFGVHGLWLKGALIGQCGLQVLNETRDQVELVIFLGKNNVRKGIGYALTRHVVHRCAEEGMRLLYGTVRPENSSALELLRRVNAKPLRTQVHFGFIATVFNIPVEKAPVNANLPSDSI